MARAGRRWPRRRAPGLTRRNGHPGPGAGDAKPVLGAAGIRRRLRRDLRIGDVVQHHRPALPRPTRHLRVRAPCDRRQRGRVRPVVHGHLLRGLHPLHDGGPPRSLPHPGPARREAGGDRAHRRQPAAHPPPRRPTRPPLAAPPAPGTDARAAGAALSGKSVHIGGVRHEFRDVPRDFRARLCVEFPSASSTPPTATRDSS
jgi:hypothetical protein